MPDICFVCGNTKSKDPGVAFHRFPQNPDKRSKWIRCLKLKKDSIKESHRICSRHFPNGDVNSDPSLVIGKKFASPIKPWSARLKRVKARDLRVLMRNASTSKNPSPVTSKSPSPMPVNTLESPLLIPRRVPAQPLLLPAQHRRTRPLRVLTRQWQLILRAQHLLLVACLQKVIRLV